MSCYLGNVVVYLETPSLIVKDRYSTSSVHNYSVPSTHIVQMLLIRRLPSMASSLATTAFPGRGRPPCVHHTQAELVYLKSLSLYPKPGCLSLCSASTSHSQTSSEFLDLIPEESSKRVRNFIF